jgi:signal transduction histidine kinase
VQGQRIEVDPRGSSELHTIANALNDYLDRNEQFVERERVFISTASHELRTPIAVMTGAAELALERRACPSARASRCSASCAPRDVGADRAAAGAGRDPARLAARAERIARTSCCRRSSTTIATCSVTRT